jgi:hypothetical protein
MATPATFSDPTREAVDLKDAKAQDAYAQGHDMDFPSERQIQDSLSKDVDLEKGAETRVGSARSDDATLDEEARVVQEAATAEERDPNIVDWDGPDDPENPQNWTDGRKWGIIATLAAVTLVTYA